MMRFGPTPFMFCLAVASQAQVDIYVQNDTARVPKVIVDVDGESVGLGGWSRDTLNLKIVVDGKQVDPESKKGRRALKEAGGEESDVAEVNNLDKLIGDMVRVFNTLPSGDSLYRAIEHEQALWLKARVIHCGNDPTTASPAEKRQVIACYRWASICRLEDLLEFYDSLNK